jgi:hypothetical protein
MEGRCFDYDRSWRVEEKSWHRVVSLALAIAWPAIMPARLLVL